MRIVYFARIREAIGFGEEVRDVLPGTSISILVDQLAAETAGYAHAFADRSKLRFALDQTMVADNNLVDGAGELAIFPPVTGG